MKTVALAGFANFFVLPLQAKVDFKEAFAPSSGMVAEVEKPQRDELCLNGRWQFQPVPLPRGWKRDGGTPPELALPVAGKWETTAVKIPSPWNVNTWGNGRKAGEETDRPYVADSLYYPSYPAEWDVVEMGWLQRKVTVPTGWEGRRIILHFEAVAGEVQVLVNGKSAGRSHFDSFLPFSYDITDLVRSGENEILVGIRKNALFNKVSPDYPAGQKRTYPNGSNTDNLVGIWNDVFLWALPAVRVDDVFVQPWVEKDELKAEVTLRNDSKTPQTVSVGGVISPWVNLAGKTILEAPVPKWKLGAEVMALPAQKVTLAPGAIATVSLLSPVGSKLKLWSPDSPNLYGLVVSVEAADKSVLDRKYTRFGWREFKIKGPDLFLNGKKIQLWGDFQHPFGPYVSSRRFVWGFYSMIKDMHANAVRPHANVMPRIWAELADEMGLCVLAEGSIFGSSINLNLKEAATWERFDTHVDDLVRRDRNHPSVFGWSPGNEMFALFFKTNEQDKKFQYDLLKKLAQRPFALDPTRNWVSIDGDQDLEGTMPVWSRHIGIGLPNDMPGPEKPRMIGEHGGTYYAGPPRTREIGGERGFESYAARNEALAFDLYRMITKVAQPDLAFFSPSELVWFGLEQLPFGYETDTRPPNRTDGIFFPNYEENIPGVQIERLPPYVMSINPGLDPDLPPYKPLAMFEAMKAALDPKGPQPSPWAQPLVAKEYPSHPQPTAAVKEVGFVGNAEGSLYLSLYALGVLMVTGEEAAKAGVLVIDGGSLITAQAEQARKWGEGVLGRGGLVWVMTVDQAAGLSKLQGLLPGQVSLTQRKATSLVPDPKHPMVAGFKPGDLYFLLESGDAQIEKAGLSGPLLASGKVLLSASNTDWSLFERQPEMAKCSSMLIYERLKKPDGAALVEFTQGKGRLWISTLDPSLNSVLADTFWKQLWSNIGVDLKKPPVQWLVSGGSDGESTWKYTTKTPGENWMKAGFDDASWKTGAGGFGTNVPNNKTRTEWKTSDIYLRQAFQAAELPRNLSLLIHHDEGVEVYLNGVEILNDKSTLANYKTIVLGEKALNAMKTGENILAVHCQQSVGGQYIDVGLSAGAVPARKEKTGHDLLLDGPVP